MEILMTSQDKIQLAKLNGRVLFGLTKGVSDFSVYSAHGNTYHAVLDVGAESAASFYLFTKGSHVILEEREPRKLWVNTSARKVYLFKSIDSHIAVQVRYDRILRVLADNSFFSQDKDKEFTISHWSSDGVQLLNMNPTFSTRPPLISIITGDHYFLVFGAWGNYENEMLLYELDGQLICSAHTPAMGPLSHCIPTIEYDAQKECWYIEGCLNVRKDRYYDDCTETVSYGKVILFEDGHYKVRRIHFNCSHRMIMNEIYIVGFKQLDKTCKCVVQKRDLSRDDPIVIFKKRQSEYKYIGSDLAWISTERFLLWQTTEKYGDISVFTVDGSHLYSVQTPGEILDVESDSQWIYVSVKLTGESGTFYALQVLSIGL